jgi:hypothetical protein
MENSCLRAFWVCKLEVAIGKYTKGRQRVLDAICG